MLLHKYAKLYLNSYHCENDTVCYLISFNDKSEIDRSSFIYDYNFHLERDILFFKIKLQSIIDIDYGRKGKVFRLLKFCKY